MVCLFSDLRKGELFALAGEIRYNLFARESRNYLCNVKISRLSIINLLESFFRIICQETSTWAGAFPGCIKDSDWILRYNRRVYLFASYLHRPNAVALHADTKWEFELTRNESGITFHANIRRKRSYRGLSSRRRELHSRYVRARTSLHGSESFVENLIYKQRLRSCRLRAMDYRLQVTDARYEQSAGCSQVLICGAKKDAGAISDSMETECYPQPAPVNRSHSICLSALMPHDRRPCDIFPRQGTLVGTVVPIKFVVHKMRCHFARKWNIVRIDGFTNV